MSRPIKQGLQYFSHDVDMSQDEKVQLIEAEFGLIGYAVINKLLERIYWNGYFLEASEKRIKLFSRQITLEVDECSNIIQACVSENLFNEKLFKTYEILTSKGIQERYLKAINRRKTLNLVEEYILIKGDLGVNADINWINVNINSENVNTSTQSKVKESKVKESKQLYGEFVLLKKEEFERLEKDYGVVSLNRMIEKLNNYFGADTKRLKKYTSHNHVLRGWVAEGLGIEKLNEIKNPCSECGKAPATNNNLCDKCHEKKLYGD